MTSTWRRLLVRLPNWVGDVVMATPALRALRVHAPRAEITVLARDSTRELLQGSPSIDRVLTLGEGEERGLRAAVSLARKLRPFRFDAALLLTNSLTSALPVFLARIPQRIGYRGDWRTPLLTHRLLPEIVEGKRLPMPMPAYYQRLLDSVGIKPAGMAYEVPWDPSDQAAALTILAELGFDRGKPLAALNPGARFGSSKLWSPAAFAEVARSLVTGRGWQVVVLCGPGEEPLAREIAQRAGPSVLDGSRRLLGLRQLRSLLELVKVFITTDSGPRHLAVAAGIPVVVLMGPTWPAWTAWNLERTIVLRHDVPCGPCHLKTCPLDHECMRSISPAEVLGAVDALLPA